MSSPSHHQWTMLLSAAIFVAGVLVVDASAQVATYNISGHLEANTNLPGGDPRQGLPFTAELTYSLNPADYTGDWQYTNPNEGEYQSLPTAAASLHLHYAGADYIDMPTLPSSTIQIWNDSGLFYNLGVPRFTGDQFAFWYYTILPQTFGDEGNSWTYNQEVLLRFYASDTSGTVFNDDSLRTVVDFSKFDDLRIEIDPVVPVGGIVPAPPPPLYYDSIEGVIDSIQAVPEPSTISLASVAAVSLVSISLRTKRKEGRPQ